jgi:competence ComEA-like helix-hairpin-helix protein
MGIQDRDYMRERRRRPRLPVFDWRRTLTLIAAIIAVLSAGVWLVRDARPLMSSLAPAKGSLVVNINTATAEELMTVPGIGQARAQQIIAARPYRAVNELDRVSGISPAQVDAMRPFITVDGETSRK